MAEVPYKASPNVEPSEQIPIHPYEAKATSENFGGLIAKGIGEFGKETTGVGERWGQIQVDYSLNNSLKEAEGVVTGYENLRGQDALEQRQPTLDRLDEIHSRAVQHLTADQVYRFDQAWRPYRDRLYAGKIQTHSTQQGFEFATAQNKGMVERGNNLAANYYNDPNVVEYARITALQGAAKDLQLNGMDRDPDVVARVFNAAESGVYKSAAEAMFAAHPAQGLAYLEEHRKELGEHYAQLAERFQNKALDDTAHGTADATVKGTDAERAGAPTGVQPKPAAAAARPSPWQSWKGNQGAAPAGPNTRAEIQIESGGRPQYGGHYAGLGQFSATEQRRFGITNPNDRRQVETALKLEANENKPALAAALGHEPAASDYYLAHQQGVAGAVSHLTHPNQPAWESMAQTAEGRARGAGWARRAIWGNMTPEMKSQFPGGVDTVTSGAFVRLWAARHDQIANRLAASEE